jgi:CubicO group peptidase (beta-lactamase class C family)
MHSITRRRLLLSTFACGFLGSRSSVAQGELPERAYWPTDQWRRHRPDRHDVDPGLSRTIEEIMAVQMPDVTGIVVVRDGYVVLERYQGDYGRDDPIKVRSVTKSVISALVGIAVDEGGFTSLEQTVGEVIPDRLPDGADPLAATVTLENLLTMTSGFAWDISTDYQRLIASDNWVNLTLSQPVVYEPGTFYAYNTGGSHLLSVMLAAATGQDTADFAQDRLFDPLGISKPAWQRSPQGEISGGFGLELTPRDMAKIGYLYLNQGRWDDAQIVPADWVAASTTYQSAGDSTGGAAYGYQWWVTDSSGYAAYFALGFGGQYIYVVPALDLVVVVAKGFETPPPLTPPRGTIEGVIIPAVTPR